MRAWLVRFLLFFVVFCAVTLICHSCRIVIPGYHLEFSGEKSNQTGASTGRGQDHGTIRFSSDGKDDKNADPEDGSNDE
jgi:hypothetical protein